ncbi:AraC family transcriptional regulator [Hydrogenoanaerobacterium saccharovorans]|uniref:Transcriptional regulator, AraC family n=1 Tax=Hydrogenoanaerobacterium saccharovorans TaxID=474960 RepID=A0A1H8E7G4_9FIRM|nr:AraC family transcriptional regulator [Hydrogenoanaerobacterium saccharovorans]RPF41954.1 AraC family transcriptional regulator [Hydrogenoanaerobacterium saccharovorans]SEN15521.1 transcriptional regulator, AraC family [Hydrogenoanaerobacterium saccharovorans]
MYVDFSQAMQPEPSPRVYLESVYHLSADKSYHVYHNPLPCGSYILIYVTSGEGVMHCSEKTFSLTSGTVLLATPYYQKFEYYTNGEQWGFWWFEFYSDFVPFEVNTNYQIQMDSFLSQLCEYSLSLHKQEKLSASSAMLSSLLTLISHQLTEESHTDCKRNLLYKAQLYIKENLAHVTVAALARAVGLNERALRSLFNEYENKSPKDYILSVKYNTACYMLKNTTKSIGEISNLLGFSSQFHFSKAFKEHFGLTPSSYRDKEYWSDYL